jgi:asparagine synthetase B (glutamine-hydrolysing)
MMLLFRDGLPAGDGTVVVGQGADGVYGLRLHQTVGAVERFRRGHPRAKVVFNPALWSAIHPLLAFPPFSVAARWGMKQMRRDSGTVDVLHKRWGPGVPQTDPLHVLSSLRITGEQRWVRRQFGARRPQIIANRAASVAPYSDRPVLDQLSLLDFLTDVAVTQSIWSKFGEASRKFVYYPFNYPPLVDAAFETPWDVKLYEAKGILRDVARQVGVPEFIVSRKKANFNIKPDRWALPGATFEPLVPLAARLFEEPEVRRMQSSRWRKAYTFWTMLNYAIWKRLFLDGESPGSLIEEVERSQHDAAVPDGEPAVA